MRNKLGKNYYDELFEVNGVTKFSVKLATMFAMNKLNRELDQSMEDAQDKEIFLKSYGIITPFRESEILLRKLTLKYESICRRNEEAAQGARF